MEEGGEVSGGRYFALFDERDGGVERNRWEDIQIVEADEWG